MGHGHDHSHDLTPPADVPAALDLTIPDSELSPSDVSRRGFLRAAGLLGAGAAASVLAVPDTAHAHPHEPTGGGREQGGFRWARRRPPHPYAVQLGRPVPGPRPAWWITVNSHSHVVHLDTSDRGPNSDFKANGKYHDPVYTGKPNLAAGDFWPGYCGRTNAGATSSSYRAVMDGLRAGRVWVDHGRLTKGAWTRGSGRRVTAGTRPVRRWAGSCKCAAALRPS